MMDEKASIGSVISLRSVSEAPEPRRKQGQRPRSGNKSKHGPSPYGTPSKKSTTKSKTGRVMLVTAIQGGGGLSSEGKMMNTWQNGRPKNMKNRTTATDYLLEQLTMNSAVSSVRPASASASTARVGGKGPVYKDAESYYDEIQALKRTLKQARTENALLKAKNGRLEDEVLSKSKKIEELLSPDTQNNDLRRTITSKNPNSSEVVMSLKRRIYKLEENLRSKENETRKMASEMKMTNFEEMKIENAIFINEIQRLTGIVQELRIKGQNFISDQAIEDAMKSGNSHKTQILLKRLTDDNRNLVLENKSLKNDLMKLTSQTENTDLEKDYEDMNRTELLQKITSLEQKLKEEESRDHRKVDKEGEEIDKEVIDDRCIELKGPLPQQVKQLRARERELLNDVEKLETTVKKLKEDRSHYRKMTDDYRKQLDELSSSKKETGNESDNGSIKSEKMTPRIPRKKSLSASRKKSSEESSHKNDVKEQQEIQNRKNSDKKLNIEEKEEKIKDVEDDYENAIISVQSAWRAHNTRRGYIANISRDNENLNDEDVLLIQSAFRGHSARSRLLAKSKEKQSSISRKSRESMRHTNDDVISDDDDDDVVMGSSVSLSKYREHQSPRRSKSRDPVIYKDPDKTPWYKNSTRNKGVMSEFLDDDDVEDYDAGRRGIKSHKKDSSLQRLKSSSSPWQRSIDERESDEEKPQASRRKNRSKDERDHQELTNKWAKSGSIRHSQKDESKTRRSIEMRKTTELLTAFRRDEESEEDDDDDLIMSPSVFRHRKVEKALDDELF